MKLINDIKYISFLIGTAIVDFVQSVVKSPVCVWPFAIIGIMNIPWLITVITLLLFFCTELIVNNMEFNAHVKRCHPEKCSGCDKYVCLCNCRVCKFKRKNQCQCCEEHDHDDESA